MSLSAVFIGDFGIDFDGICFFKLKNSYSINDLSLEKCFAPFTKGVEATIIFYNGKFNEMLEL